MVNVDTYYQFRRRRARIRISEAYALSEERDTCSTSRRGNMDMSLLKTDKYPDIPNLYCFPRRVASYSLRRKL